MVCLRPLLEWIWLKSYICEKRGAGVPEFWVTILKSAFPVPWFTFSVTILSPSGQQIPSKVDCAFILANRSTDSDLTEKPSTHVTVRGEHSRRCQEAGSHTSMSTSGRPSSHVRKAGHPDGATRTRQADVSRVRSRKPVSLPEVPPRLLLWLPHLPYTLHCAL